jgi:L-seryl-tRNA(Ser) seleniumtransferase
VSDPRRNLPSVSALLERDAVRALLERAPRSVVVDAVRATIDEARSGASVPHDDQAWAAAIGAALERAQRPSLRPVINGTGVVLHTNLGRAPLATVALEAVQRTASGYSNLEYDIERGTRGSRYDHCVALLRELTGAEDALVVNNNAAALVLALNTFASGRGAVISRGELVEIGGSFRIPEIMERSGARLVEVGTTNRTHADDYAAALRASDVGAIVKVHRSNFEVKGFVSEVPTRELVSIVRGVIPRAARDLHVPVIHDLGSGLLIPLDAIGLTGEPTAAQVVADGATLVTMSGDKLLGGPQAGIIVGTADAVKQLRGNPLVRSVRVDKLTLAALEATLALYRDPTTALRDVPVLAMLSRPVDELRQRAHALRARLDSPASVVESDASVGGGAFPNARIASIALAFSRDIQALESRLRLGEPAVIARIAEGLFVWTANAGSGRLDAYLVRIPTGLLDSPVPPPPPPSGASEAVRWVSRVNVTATGGTLRKTDGCSGCPDAGAISEQRITSGGGAIQVTASEIAASRTFGLSIGNSGTSSDEIRFGIRLRAGYAQVRESGVYETDVPFVSGDRFEVRLSGGVVRYFKNGTAFYTSSRSVSYPMLVDSSLSTVGATLTNAVFRRLP